MGIRWKVGIVMLIINKFYWLLFVGIWWYNFDIYFFIKSFFIILYNIFGRNKMCLVEYYVCIWLDLLEDRCILLDEGEGRMLKFWIDYILV